MMAEMAEIPTNGYPVQIFHFYRDRPTLNVKGMKVVLEKVGDRPVAIVSINGPVRSGKSFLLNFLMRHALQSQKKDQLAKKVVNKDHGFEWKGGRNRTTVGIWVWSEPLPVVDKFGQEVGVILMDTQGLFDSETNIHSNALIFCVSIWLSSVFIYNIKGEVSEDRLQFVELFTEMAQDVASEGPPSADTLFQKCILLVRDWQNRVDNDYGVHRRIRKQGPDGNTRWTFEPPRKNYVHEVLVAEDTLSDEAIETRRTVLNSFTDLSACLLPHPGKAIANSQDGAIKVMDEEFETHMLRLCAWVLDKDYLVPRIINGSTQTGKTLQPIIEKWAKLISENQLPQSRSMAVSTAESNLRSQLLRAQKAFDKKFSECLDQSATKNALRQDYKKLADTSLDSFKSNTKQLQEKFGNEHMFHDDLQEYMTIQYDNGAKILEGRLMREELEREANEFQQRKQKDDYLIRQLQEDIRAVNAQLRELSTGILKKTTEECNQQKESIRLMKEECSRLARENERQENQLKERDFCKTRRGTSVCCYNSGAKSSKIAKE